jgi:hypothetical protein
MRLSMVWLIRAGRSNARSVRMDLRTPKAKLSR